MPNISFIKIYFNYYPNVDPVVKGINKGTLIITKVKFY